MLSPRASSLCQYIIRSEYEVTCFAMASSEPRGTVLICPPIRRPIFLWLCWSFLLPGNLTFPVYLLGCTGLFPPPFLISSFPSRSPFWFYGLHTCVCARTHTHKTHAHTIYTQLTHIPYIRTTPHAQTHIVEPTFHIEVKTYGICLSF